MKLWDKPGYIKRDPKMYPNCKQVVYHKPDKCLELEANKENKRDNWESLLCHGEGTWTVNVLDSVKNKLARSDVLQNYWSPLNCLFEEHKKHPIEK